MSKNNSLTLFPRNMFSKKCLCPGLDNEDEKTVLCTKIMEDGKPCGCYGHPDYYKNSDDTLILVIKHAHFLPDLDKGRNVFHSIKEVKAPESIKIPTWKTYRGKNRWTKIPKMVRENLGWD